MRIRYLGHSCVEIMGKAHIVIDPDFTRPPAPDIDTICVTHAHLDHLGRVAELQSGQVLASASVCRIAERMGVPRERLCPVQPGDTVGIIRVLPGHSIVGGLKYMAMKLLFKRKLPEPGGKPLSFLIEDDVSVLHIGDAHLAPPQVQPDLLCLPWRSIPRGANQYQSTMVALAQEVAPRYVLPVHHDMPPFDADPLELVDQIDATVLCGEGWHEIAEEP